MKSSVPALKVALKARLKADPAFAGEDTMVSIGNPHPARATRELVAIGKVSNRVTEYRGSMSQGRETYDIAVLASVIGSAALGHEELLVKAYELAADVVASVLDWRNNAQRYDGIVDIITEGVSDDDEAVDTDGREVSVTLSFHVTASIV